MKEFYRRRLPHVVPPGGVFFITCRLKDSLPRTVLKQLQERTEYELNLINANSKFSEEEKERRRERLREQYFLTFDNWLDQVEQGPTWLQSPAVAQVVADKFQKYNGLYYDLIAFTIMSNHYHLLLDTYPQVERLPPGIQPDDDNYVPLHRIMNLINGASAFEANRILSRRGSFWKPEPYDRLVRDGEEFRNVIRYIADNPVKAQLVNDWRDWHFTYVKEEYWHLMEG